MEAPLLRGIVNIGLSRTTIKILVRSACYKYIYGYLLYSYI